MFQIIIALIIIAGFLARLIWQKHLKQITASEYLFWMSFWLLSAVIISSIKQIDKLVSSLGFTGSGIQVLLYLAVATLFYLVFRIRLKQERLERDISKLNEALSREDFIHRHH